LGGHRWPPGASLGREKDLRGGKKSVVFSVRPLRTTPTFFPPASAGEGGRGKTKTCAFGGGLGRAGFLFGPADPGRKKKKRDRFSGPASDGHGFWGAQRLLGGAGRAKKGAKKFLARPGRGGPRGDKFGFLSCWCGKCFFYGGGPPRGPLGGGRGGGGGGGAPGARGETSSQNTLSGRGGGQGRPAQKKNQASQDLLFVHRRGFVNSGFVRGFGGPGCH